MLVTFKCRYYHNIVMFGDSGVALLKAMGQSGRVPGAIGEDAVDDALVRLQAAMRGERGDAETASGEEEADDAQDNKEPVTLRQRAIPLLEMLEVAAKEHCGVMWE